MRCVAHVLTQQEMIEVLGETTHAQAAIALADQLKPSIVVMDIHMPGLDPFQASKEILRVTHGKSRIVFYTGFASDQYLDRCIEAGAAGMISKHTESIKNLGAAIRHVAKGGSYYSPELARRLVEVQEGSVTSRFATLAERERQVLQEVSKGKSQLEIAEHLDVSERTVNKAVSELKTKLELESINQLILFAVNEGLVHPELLFSKS